MIFKTLFIGLFFSGTLLLSSTAFSQSFEEVIFTSNDGLRITADLYHHHKKAPTIILFHQSASSRGEFRTIAPGLHKLGFNCLSVDLRWGKQDFWNKIPNETAQRNGSFKIIDDYENNLDYQLNQVWPVIWKAYDDMKASVEYIKSEGYIGKTIVLGSSFSAMLVFKLVADRYPVDGIAAFSPGEYHPSDSTLLSEWSKKINVPVYLSAGSSELEMVKEVNSFLPSGLDVEFHHSNGRHGASVLINEEQDWESFSKFLSTFKEEKEIGFKIFKATRASESWDIKSTTKTITGWYWYPIQESASNHRMTYANYVWNLNSEKTNLENEHTFTRMISNFSEDSISNNVLMQFIHSEIPVLFNEKPEYTRPGLVVISGAHPIYFISLAEKITQLGFPVLFVPRTGLQKGEPLPFNREGILEYKQDLEAALVFLSEEELIYTENLIFISWSFEGVPTLELANDFKTTSFISLDSSIGYEYGENLILEKTLEEISFPVLHYTGSDMGFGKSLDLIKKYPSKVTINKNFELTHGDFTSLGSITVDILQDKRVDSTYQNLIMQLIHNIDSSKPY